LVTGPRNPEVSTQELLRHVRENYEHTEVLVTTECLAADTAFRVGRLGAHAYLPLTNGFEPHHLLPAVDSALEHARLRRLADPTLLHPTNGTRWGMLGESPAMQEVFRRIEDVARFDDSVLILGETGTGKELTARAIHQESGRPGPLVAINCAGMPADLLESELFGHSRGAFTGADRDKTGLFAAANGGTLLLDEIGDMSPKLQPKLLRVLEDRRVRPVGSIEEIAVDVRVLASTHQDLEHLVTKRRFRQDLFYRLNVLTVRLPPLRERGDDVLLLFSHLLKEKAANLHRSPPRCTAAVIAAIRACRWKGNVRELENLVSRMLASCHRDTIDLSDLPRSLRSTTAAVDERLVTLEEKKREYCRYVFAKTRWNVVQAAKILDIDPKTLRARLPGVRSRTRR
jgi:DNA-binding NtrC family response regulator